MPFGSPGKRSASSSPAATKGKAKKARSVGSTSADPGTLPALFSAAKAKAVPPAEGLVDVSEPDHQPESEESATSAEPVDAATPSASKPSASTVSLEEIEALKAFDLNEKFGPCVGPSRLQRWKRADKWGLDPPPEVLAILESLDPDDEEHQCLWRKHV